MFSILDRVINRPNDYIENKSSYVIIACLKKNIRHSDTPSIVKTVVKKLRSIGEKHWSGRKRQRIPRRWSRRGQSAHTEKRKREIRGKRGGSDDTGKQAAEVTSCWVPNRSLGASQSPGYNSHPLLFLFVAHLARRRAGYARHACTTSSLRYNLQVVDRCASSNGHYTALKFEIRDVCVSTLVASRENVRWKKTVESRQFFLRLLCLIRLMEALTTPKTIRIADVPKELN